MVYEVLGLSDIWLNARFSQSVGRLVETRIFGQIRLFSSKISEVLAVLQEGDFVHGSSRHELYTVKQESWGSLQAFRQVSVLEIGRSGCDIFIGTIIVTKLELRIQMPILICYLVA